jgi:hypothetical protein
MAKSASALIATKLDTTAIENDIDAVQVRCKSSKDS